MVDDEPTASREMPLTQLAELQRAFESALAEADPEAPVPGCGGWSVRELAEHLGSVHVWAAGKVLGERLERPGSAAERGGAPEARSLAIRYRADAELLRTTLSSVPTDQPCQTFTGVGPASFWQRRQTHETLIHLWDLSQALGSAMPDVQPAVWADCVAEVVEVLHPRQLRLGRAKDPQECLLLVSERSDRQWQVPAESLADPAAVIRASDLELALLLWGRLDEAGLAVSGDARAAAAVLAGPLTP
ncbi:maleylpyruvate isomerase family mycothiol-dependent enzyme [Nesterenkonia sp. E16_7]|uniref:maleylpyruvate isomerase family mycothiol-dependent enzyme n=1 Tax=unclassified Nesterenkonia TaxID=2629769 RepID=UPI001A923839|nr:MULTISPECIES: maleylpyruvate isomerase family mycothiol-dependent enzyme [unclassified Nesterenkonia]MBO0594825.1 maleylpyruvate isomerase family mycothiol-dependent enzyme [Nesterenkonia sp. E16_10]MBO0597074.1 maleylpyruvate isomerase family mycothiol-dependent enzyme [Nesterenkonia sp. E16_7]